jgi:hypothetical protein
MEMQLELSVAAVELVFRQLELREPGEEVGVEDLPAAVERIAGEPDQLLLRQSHGARMIELVAQLCFIDLVGDAHAPGTVDQRKGRVHVGVETSNHLQHQ